MRIPKKIVFPFGFIVQIKTVTREEIGIATNDPSPGYAAYHHDTKTIYLDKARPIKQRRADFTHEVGHAYLDWQAWILNTPYADAKDP